MIRVEKSNKSESYWRHDGLYDSKYEKSFAVKVFGVTFWHKVEKLDCNLKEEIKNGVGFKG